MGWEGGGGGDDETDSVVSEPSHDVDESDDDRLTVSYLG